MGAWEEIVDYTVPSNTTSVTFNNFGTITKDDFIRVNFTHINPTSSASVVSLYPNGNTTGSNYHRQFLEGNGSTVVANRGNDFSLLNFTRGSVNGYSSAYIKLSENDRFNMFNNFVQRIDSGLYNTFNYVTSSGATFTSGITSFTLNTNVSNSIGANSRIQIYRLAAEKVADVVVTSNTTQVDITGLDIKKGDEYLLVSDWKNNGSTVAQNSLFVNDNTTSTNYYSQRIGGTSSTTFATRFNDSVYHRLLNANTNLGYAHIKLSNIGAFTFQNYTMEGTGTNSPLVINHFASSTAENITSIAKLNLRSDITNGIGNGTRFELYKLYEGGN